MKDEESDRSSQPKNAKKKTFSCKIAIFEEQDDPNIRRMYPRHLVYADGKDIQLEEIRAMHYWNKVKGTRGDSNFGQITKSFRNMSTQTDPEPEKSTRVVEACTQTEVENSHLALNSKIPTISPTQVSNEPSNEKASAVVLSNQNDANTSNVRSSEENLSIPKSRSPNNITVVLARRSEPSESNVQSIQPQESLEVFKPACTNTTMVLAGPTKVSESNFHPEIPQVELSDSPAKEALVDEIKSIPGQLEDEAIASNSKSKVFKPAFTNTTMILAGPTKVSESNFHPEIPQVELSDSPAKEALVDEIKSIPGQLEDEAIASNSKSNHESIKLLSSRTSRITTRSKARARLGSKTRSKSGHSKKNIEKELPKLPVVPTSKSGHSKKNNIEKELPKLPVVPIPKPAKIEDENLVVVDDEDDSFTTKAMKLRPTSTPATPFEKMKNKNVTNRKRGGKYF